MSGARSFVQNVSSAWVMRLASAAFGFLFFMLLARRWGSTALGEFATVFAFFTLLQQAPLLGLHVLVMRRIAEQRDAWRAEAASAAVLALSAALLLALGVIAVAVLFYPPRLHLPFAVMALSLLPTAVINVMEAVLWGQERAGLQSTLGAFENVFRAMAGAALVLLGQGLVALWLCVLAGRLLLVWGMMRFGALSGCMDRRAVSREIVRRDFSACPTFLGILLLSSAISRADFIVLSRLGTLADVGLYSAAYKIHELAMMVPMLVSLVLFPIFTRTLQASTSTFDRLTRRTFRLYFLAGAPLVTCLALLAPWLVSVPFGAAYAGSAPLLQVLSGIALVAGLDQVLTIVQLAKGRQADDLRVLLVSCAVYLALLVGLIPRLGALGAAVATLAACVVQFVARWAVTWSRVGLPALGAELLRPATAAAAMITVAWLLPVPAMWLRLGVALVVYAAVSAALRVVPASEVAGLRAALAGGRTEPE